MEKYKTVECPYNCGKESARYRIDSNNESKAHVTCNRCHERYTIIHGNQQIRAKKGYI